MKVIAIGDVHGRSDWKRVAEKEIETCDKLVFIGDYFDSWDKSAQEQMENFNEIIELKKRYADKVVLLIGNHDFHYMTAANQTYSGFQAGASPAINQLLEHAYAEGLMQVCYRSGEVMFSHAGITKTWVKDNIGLVDNIGQLEFFVNELFKHKRSAFRFTPGESMNNYGDEICQTPIWVRPRALVMDAVFADTITQVVGHTQQPEIAKVYREDDDINHDKAPAFVLIDAPDSWEYLEILDGQFNVKEFV